MGIAYDSLLCAWALLKCELGFKTHLKIALLVPFCGPEIFLRNPLMLETVKNNFLQVRLQESDQRLRNTDAIFGQLC